MIAPKQGQQPITLFICRDHYARRNLNNAYRGHTIYGRAATAPGRPTASGLRPAGRGRIYAAHD